MSIFDPDRSSVTGAVLLAVGFLAVSGWYASDKPVVATAFGAVAACWLVIALRSWRRDREAKR